MWDSFFIRVGILFFGGYVFFFFFYKGGNSFLHACGNFFFVYAWRILCTCDNMRVLTTLFVRVWQHFLYIWQHLSIRMTTFCVRVTTLFISVTTIYCEFYNTVGILMTTLFYAYDNTLLLVWQHYYMQMTVLLYACDSNFHPCAITLHPRDNTWYTRVIDRFFKWEYCFL